MIHPWLMDRYAENHFIIFPMNELWMTFDELGKNKDFIQK